jgi:DNA polymerase-3 subunit alpha
MLDPAQPVAASPKVQLPEWPATERLAAEKELLGFYVTGHPLEPYRSILDVYALTDTERILELPNRTITRLGGIISAVQQGFSKKSGKPYALLTLEDTTPFASCSSRAAWCW